MFSIAVKACQQDATTRWPPWTERAAASPPWRAARRRLLAVVVVWLRQRRRRPAALRGRHAERPDARRAVLRRRQRLHADLRPDARGEHGPRLALPARRLPRAGDAGGVVQGGRRARARRSAAATRRPTAWWPGSCRCCSRRRSSASSASLIQQVFLRWNQGQDLRQALITIALSVIFADQMLAAFGGISKDIKTPTAWPNSIDLPGDVRFGFFRGVVVLGSALLIGLGLWYVIKRTRFGKIVRAGVDDRDMVSALGINVQLVFAGAFLLGAMLAGFGGVLGGTMISLGARRGHRVPAQLADRRDHRRHGLARRRRDRRARARPRRRLRRRLPRLRRHRPHELLDPRHVRAARRRARGRPLGLFGRPA